MYFVDKRVHFVLPLALIDIARMYTSNFVVDTHDTGFQALAGRDYAAGEVVDKTLFIIDRNNGKMPSLLGRNDIVPFGIINHYKGSLSEYNVILDSLDEGTRYITIRASKPIKQGQCLVYQSKVKHNPINHKVFHNYISKSNIAKAGNGVFAGCDYKKGDIIAINTFTPIHRYEAILKDYVFKNPRNNPYHKSRYYQQSASTSALSPLGVISLMNHSQQPNVNPYSFDQSKMLTTAVALRDIKQHEELFISYGPNWWKQRAMRAQ